MFIYVSQPTEAGSVSSSVGRPSTCTRPDCNSHQHEMLTHVLTVHCCCYCQCAQDSRGNMHVRNEVAKFIEERDGVGPADPNVSAVCLQRQQ